MYQIGLRELIDKDQVQQYKSCLKFILGYCNISSKEKILIALRMKEQIVHRKLLSVEKDSWIVFSSMKVKYFQM